MKARVSNGEKNFQDDFDFITSQLTLGSQKSQIRRSHWRVLLKNINSSYKSVANFIKWGKEEALSKAVLAKWKRSDDFYVYKFTEGDRLKKFEDENEWYKAEYVRQVGEPPEEDHEALMKRAVTALKLRSFLNIDKLLYRPPIRYGLDLEQPNWNDTPLAITCKCPVCGACSCFDRKASLLQPAKRIPWKAPGNVLGIKMFCCFCCRPSGTFAPKLAKRVSEESENYRDPKVRKRLLDRGPEFCMTRCMQFMAASVKLDAKLAAEIGKMQVQIDSAGLDDIDGFEGGKFDVPNVMDTSPVFDAFTRTEATQTENDPATGELLMGEYTRVLYGEPKQTVVSDAQGARLEISNYVYAPPDPCVFNINDMFCFDGIKNQMSRIKKLYKTSLSGVDNSSFRKLSCVCRGSGIRESMISVLKKELEDESSGSLEKADAEIHQSSDDVIDNGISHHEQCFSPFDKLQQFKEFLKRLITTDNCASTYPTGPCKKAFNCVSKRSTLKSIKENTSEESVTQAYGKKYITIATSKSEKILKDIGSLTDGVNHPMKLKEFVKELNQLKEEDFKFEIAKRKIEHEKPVIIKKVKSEPIYLNKSQSAGNDLEINILDNQSIVRNDTITINIPKEESIGSFDRKIRRYLLKMKKDYLPKNSDCFPYERKSQQINDSSKKISPGECFKKTSSKYFKFSWQELFSPFISRTGSDRELNITEYISQNSSLSPEISSSIPKSLTSEKEMCSSFLNTKKSRSFAKKTSKSSQVTIKQESLEIPSLKQSSHKSITSMSSNKTSNREIAQRKQKYRFYY